jgi:tagatose 6-phosphate kinase
VITVVALNPALDITHEVDGADWAGVNRPHAVHVRPGGKGVNVARTLRALGAEVTLTGLAGGSTGRELAAGLVACGIQVALTEVAGATRRTFAVVDAARDLTAVFNEPGPAISEGEYAGFLVTYQKTVAGCAAVVLSGSLPPGLADDAYAGLIAAAEQAGVPVVLDTSGAALRHGAAAGPALVKPNLAELEAALERGGRSVDRREPWRSAIAKGKARARADRIEGARAAGGPDPDAVTRAARELTGPGAVVVSLGQHGLLAVTADGTWHARPARVVAGNPTGAGDAVVAALTHGLVSRQDWPDRLRHAAALGAAAVAAPVAGEFHAGDYQSHLPEILVTELPLAGRGAAIPGRGARR